MKSLIKENSNVSYRWLGWISISIIIMNVYLTSFFSLFLPIFTSLVNSALLVFATGLLIIYFILETQLNLSNITFTPIDICLFLSLVVIIATSKGETDNFTYIIRFVILTIIVILCKYDQKIIDMIFIVFLIVGTVHVVLTLFFYFDNNFYLTYIYPRFDPDTRSKLYYWNTVNHYATGLSEHFSTNGILISIACLLSSLLFYRKGKKRKLLYTIIFAIFVITLFMTGKRAVLIFVFFAIAMAFLFCNRSSSLSKLGIAFVAVCGLALVVNVAYQNIESVSSSLDRFAEIFNSKDISNGRFDLYAIAWDYFLSAPIFGIGWKQFSKEVVVYYHQDTYVRDTHNVFLQLLCETGVVGFLVFMALFVIAMYYTISLIKKSNENRIIVSQTDRFALVFSLTMQVFFLSYALSGNPLYDIETLYPYILSIGFTSSVYYRYIKKPILDANLRNRRVSKYIK